MADTAVVRWFNAHDPEHYGLKRGVRTAITATVMLAIGTLVGNPQMALLGVFGGVATLLFVDFPGNRKARWAGYGLLGIFGLILICLGTLASQNSVLSVVGMAVFGFVILFAGVLSAGAAAAGKAAILLFLLPVMVPGSPSDIPPRLAGWILGWLVSVLLSMFLWPRRDFDRLRTAVSRVCRATARAVSAPSALDDPPQLDQIQQAAVDAMSDLRTAFRASTSRPVGLSAGGRLLGRTINDLESLFADSRDISADALGARETATVAKACADVLDASADALDAPEQTHRARLRANITELGTVREQALSSWLGSVLERGQARASGASVRMHVLAYSTDQVGRHVAASIDADARPVIDKFLGRGTTVVAANPISAMERLTRYHLSWRSVWFHNSLRGGLGLALAVLVAQLLDVQHGFWVGLGTLSVLRSNASNTGSTALRATLGTAVGVLVAAPVLVLLGTGPSLWLALPVGMFLAGFATATLPLAVGQGAFSAAVLVLFALLDPGGGSVGLIRIEDVVIGCVAAVVVGLLLWPRGAAAEIRRATADAYRRNAHLLSNAVARLIDRPAPAPLERREVRGAALRLDDALRQYLADRGGKVDQIDDLVAVCVGAERVRLASEALAALAEHPQEPVPADLASFLRGRTEEQTRWLNTLATALTDDVRGLPEAPPPDAGTVVVQWAERHADEATAVLTSSVNPLRPSPLVWVAIHLDDLSRQQRRVRSRVLGLVRPGGTASVDAHTSSAVSRSPAH